MKNLSFIPKIGLFYKIASLVLLMLIVAIGLATAVSITEQTKTIETELIEKNRTVSMHLASSVKSAFWSLNWLFVERQMQEIAKSGDVKFLKLIKPNSETYMSSGDIEPKEDILPPGLMNIKEQVIKENLFSEAGVPVKMIITPIKVGNDKWSLIMRLSLKRVEDAKRAIIRNNIVLGSTILLFGVLVSFFFARGMTKPITKLVEGTKEIGKGNLDYSIEVRGRDELKNLADSFNRMAEDLKKTTASRDQLLVEIDERRQAEEALRESEEKYRGLFENSTNFAFALDLKGNFTDVNKTALNLTGYTKNELIGMNFRRYTKKDSHEEIYKVFNSAFKEGKPLQNFPLEVTIKDGTKRYFETSVTALRKSGEIIGFQGCSNDITERKQAEEALRESEERFRSIVENSHSGILIVDDTHRFAYVNDKLCEILGYPSQEIIGHDFRKFLHEKSKPLVADHYTRRQRGESVSSRYEFNIVRKSGEIRDVEISSSVIKNSNGTPRTIAQILDITERKRLETQLRKAQKMEAIGTLAGGVAHDLNNILSGIVSYPELLLMDIPDDSPLRNPILTIQKSGKKAAAIVQDLLTLARRGVAITEVVNLNTIISEYLESPEHKKLKSFHPDIEIHTDLESALLNIKGSPVHLSKTIMNLISNAAEAMPDGGEVSISTQNQYMDRPLRGYDDVKQGDYVILKVSDNGVGISKEDMERIFEPFYTKKVMGRSGTGLGMAVVWGTVKDHRGYIDVHSLEEKGSTFTLYFPVTRKNMAKDESVISLEDYMGKGETILVVDDVKEQREIASGMLRKLGYTVNTVSSGEEAVEYMRNHSADLLILDMIMDPGIDGLETYKRILELYPEQKAIIASGFSESKSVKQTQRLGAGAYVKKPYMLEKIGLAVRAELGK